MTPMQQNPSTTHIDKTTAHTKLNPKQKSFVQAYAAGQSAHDAACHAGYSLQNASTTARRLLQNPDIQAALQCLKGESQASTVVKQAEPTEQKAPRSLADSATNCSGSAACSGAANSPDTTITTEAVVRELAAIGFANMNDICTWSEDGVTLLHSDDIPREARAAVAEVRESGTARGGVLVKMHPKLRALEMLGRHLGMFSTAQVSAGQSQHNSMAFDAAQALFDDADNALPEAILHKLNAVYGHSGRQHYTAHNKSPRHTGNGGGDYSHGRNVMDDLSNTDDADDIDDTGEYDDENRNENMDTSFHHFNMFN